MRSESCSFIWHPKVRTTYVPDIVGSLRVSVAATRTGPSHRFGSREVRPALRWPTDRSIDRDRLIVGIGYQVEVDRRVVVGSPIPTSARIRSETSTMISGLSTRKDLAFSLPCPICSPS